MANEVRAKIAAEVRAEVARQKKSQREIASMLGVDQAGAWRRLNGEQPWRADELVKLAEALGVPVAQFLGERAA